MKPSTKYLKIAINIASVLLVFAFCVWILPRIIVFFMPFVIAGIIALIANPLVRFLEQKLKIVRKAGTVVVIVLVLGLVVLVCYAVIAKLIEETVGFFGNAPQILADLSDTLDNISDKVNLLSRRMPEGIREWLDGVGDSAVAYFADWVSGLGEPIGELASSIAAHLPSIIVSTIMCILASYLFVAEREYLEKMAVKFVPERLRERFSVVTSTMTSAVGGYFKAQLKIMVFVYAVLLVGLVVIDVDYAFLIALLIAILDFLPFFGSGAAMWPWALVEVFEKEYKLAIGIMIVWGLSQLIRQLIQPKLVGDSIGLAPIPTLIFLYVGFKVGGALGLILAVPIGMIIINLYKAGVFSNFVYSIQLLVKDLAKLRVFNKDDLISEGIIPKENESGDTSP